MNHERLDRGCRAKVLFIEGENIMIRAWWPASKNDEKRFNVIDGTAINTTIVSRSYFERRYGVAP